MQPSTPANSAPVLCKACKTIVRLTDESFQDRAVEGQAGGLKEIGIVCPKCKSFTHACFDNDSLFAMREELKQITDYHTRRTKMLAYRTTFHQLQTKNKLLLAIPHGQ